MKYLILVFLFLCGCDKDGRNLQSPEAPYGYYFAGHSFTSIYHGAAIRKPKKVYFFEVNGKRFTGKPAEPIYLPSAAPNPIVYPWSEREVWIPPYVPEKPSPSPVPEDLNSIFWLTLAISFIFLLRIKFFKT